MNGRVEIVEFADRGRWDAAVGDDGFPSQAWEYAAGVGACGVEPRLAVVEAEGGRLVVPFVERRWRDAVDIATPISLSGASLSGPGRAVLACWRDYARSRGWVAGYLQLAPGADIGLAGATDTDADRVVASNRVFVLALGPDGLEGTAEIVRRKIRRARVAGVRLVDDAERVADALVALYPQTVARLAIPARAAYPEAALRTWATARGTLALGAELGGRVVAASLFPRRGTRAEYQLNAAGESGRDLAAWLLDEAARRLAATGVRTLELGGGVRPGDGLHAFKARFHGVERPLQALCQVYDAGRYAALVASAGASPDETWFPAYRAGSDRG